MIVDGRSRKAALKRIAKQAMDNNIHPEIHGWFKENDKWCLCDGYRFVRLKDKVDIDVEDATGMNLQQFVRELKEEVVLPDIETLKAWTKDKVAKNKPFRLEYGKDKQILANASYLKDMLDIFGQPFCNICQAGSFETLYFSGDDGDGILFPIR